MESELMNNKLNEPKDIFSHFGGSKYFMAREDMLNRYNEFNISKETESKWLKEIYNNRVKNMNINSLCILNK